MIVIHNNEIVYENYWLGNNESKKHISWSNSLIHIINIPSIHNMSNVEKNTLWYNHDNICSFGQTELLPGIQCIKCMFKGL